MNVRVSTCNAADQTLNFDVVKPPWPWRNFLVLDQGDQLTYVPLENVVSWSTDEMI